MQRRQLLTAAGGVVAGGSIVAFTSSKSASAQVQFGSLNVENRTYEQTSELQDVSIRVNANWKYEADQPPERWGLILSVGKPEGELTQIAEARRAPMDKAASGTHEVTGSILDTPHFAIENFRVDSQSKTVPMAVSLVFRVIHNGEVSASASVQDTTELTVKPGSVDASAQVKGNGEIVLSK